MMVNIILNQVIYYEYIWLESEVNSIKWCKKRSITSLLIWERWWNKIVINHDQKREKRFKKILNENLYYWASIKIIENGVRIHLAVYIFVHICCCINEKLLGNVIDRYFQLRFERNEGSMNQADTSKVVIIQIE